MLDLANDCFRFVMQFFEVISSSAPHIYHTALLLSPKESIVQALYGSQVNPLVTVIQGVPTLWDPSIASARFPDYICATRWSPCSRFFALAWNKSPKVVILDAVTLKQLYTMYPQGKEHTWELVVFSLDSHLLAGYSWVHGCITIWDLQTGGVIGNISIEGNVRCNSMTLSECGTMLGGIFNHMSIMVYNILSGKQILSNPVQPPVKTIWTHGEYLQFATIASESIIIWQISFISVHQPTKVGSLSTPDNFSLENLVLLPALSRIALVDGDRVVVWDAHHHKVLLDSTDAEDPHTVSFSSDGSFFICGTRGRGSYLWKKSPDGYLPHQKLMPGSTNNIPLISPNGESVISSNGVMVQLWHTTNSSTSFPDHSAQDLGHYGDFVTDISTDGSLVAIARKLSHMVAIFPIETGTPQLVIDANTKICDLKVTRDRIIAIGDGRIVTWDLLTNDNVLNAHKVQTATFEHPGDLSLQHISVSPNLHYFAIGTQYQVEDLCIYDVYNGNKLAFAISGTWIPGFTPDSCGVWCSAYDDDDVDQWEIVKQDGSNAIKLEQVESTIKQQSGLPWQSSCGYQITENGMVLSSSGDQLLWLPHHWRPDTKFQMRWSGKFLVVWNGLLPEPIIFKLEA